MRNGKEVRHCFKSAKDIDRFWHDVRKVPLRRKRAKRDEERYCVGLLLLARATRGLLQYPIIVAEGESPDFRVIEPGATTKGLEITKATTPNLQKQMTLAEDEFARRQSDAEKTGIPPEPVAIAAGTWVGDQAEREWVESFKESVTKKLGKLCGYADLLRHDLLIYDDTPTGDVTRGSVLPTLAAWITDQRARNPLLGTVSIIMSLDVVYDIDGVCETLPYLDLAHPERERDLGERLEHAAQVAVSRELHRSAR